MKNKLGKLSVKRPEVVRSTMSAILVGKYIRKPEVV
jgi:hypothetical protein